MTHSERHTLVINGGSSSIKFSVFETDSLRPIFHGEIERIGTDHAFIRTTNDQTQETQQEDLHGKDAVEVLIANLERSSLLGTLTGIGYRVVHGGERYYAPTILNDEVLAYLEHITSFAPKHLPSEIALIRALMQRIPQCEHCACFDTAFHHTMPSVAQLLPLPLRYREQGVRRYGFHGISYEFLLETLDTQWNEPIEKQRIVLAHLGSGASLSAVKYGKPVDTTMSFTPNSGIPMSTRTGDLDAGLFHYLSDVLKMTPNEIDHMVNHDGGLLAVSQSSADMEKLLRDAATHEGSRMAIEYFVYHVQKQIGALAAAMGGIDMLVFTGGIGERSAEIRKQVCHNLAFLGVALDETANQDGRDRISDEEGGVVVYRIPTNEELMIARQTRKLTTPVS